MFLLVVVRYGFNSAVFIDKVLHAAVFLDKATSFLLRFGKETPPRINNLGHFTLPFTNGFETEMNPDCLQD